MGPPPLRRVVSALMVVLLAAGGLGLAVAPAQAVSSGTALGWGSDYYGESSPPAGLAGKDVTAIAAGYFHSLALTTDGQVTAFGDNDQGQSNVPASLSSQTVTAIAAGGYHSLALTTDGQVTAWGSNGQGESNVPASLASQTVTAIAAGYDYSVALTSDGQVTAWGQNMFGQSSIPASLSSQTVTAISAGYGHVLALNSDGHATAWGRNDYGQTNLPASLSSQTVTAISGGDLHSLALTSDGQVTAWGYNDNGETNVPAGLASQTVTAIAAGGYHSLALTSDGQVTAWGWNIHGQTTVPAAPGGAPYTAIAGGVYNSLGIVASNEFTTATTATITGSPQVGQVLTADAGEVAPAPDSYSYRWFADGTLISGASSATFTPSAAEQGAVITVEIKAVKTGYTSSTDTSEATEPVMVTPQATPLVVTAQRGLHLAREPITVAARGLDGAESYIVRIGGTQVAAGSATSTGTLTRRVILPSRARDGLASVTVTGSESDRTGSTTTRVLTNKTLGLRLKHRRVQVRHRQWVKITGLASREKILVGFKGRRVSPRYARADTNGVYRLAFRVGKTRGIKTVRVRGQFAGRTAAKTFRVTRY